MIETIGPIGDVVLQAEGGGGPALTDIGAAAIAVGLGALGTGYAQRGIGAAAIGAVAEDDPPGCPVEAGRAVA